MMRLAILASLTTIVLALPEPVQAAPEEIAGGDFYVAANGDDRHPGTREKPFATLARARDAIRQHKEAGLTGDLTVIIRGGNYPLKEPVVFGPKDSGTREHAIRYVAAPGETPLFSGGRELPAWQPGPAGRWTVALAEVKNGSWHFDQLFIGGQRLPRARHPNEGYLRVAAAGPDNRTSFLFQPGDLKAYSRLEDAELVFLHDWSISRIGIQEIDVEQRRLLARDRIGAGAAFFAISGFEPHARYAVENSPDLLDAPGEWYLDRTEGVLHYLPRAGEQIDQARAIAPVLPQLLVVQGERQRPVMNLHFVGLSFAYAASPTFPKGYAGIQAGFHEPRQAAAEGGAWRNRMPAAVVLDTVQHCRLERCSVRHVGGTAVSIEGPAESSAVLDCEITDAGGNGVMVGEPSTALEQLARQNVVRNNHIFACGQRYFGCVGVWVGITEATTVAHNEIHDLPYSGVSVGWVWNTSATPCRDNRIEKNHIHHVMQILSDGGGIYTLGRQPGTVLRGNVIHDVPLNAGRAESNGMFIDEGSSEMLIEDNIIYQTERSPIRFHRATGNVLRANTLVTPAGTPPFRYNSTDEASMKYEANQTPAADGWQPPPLARTGAGRQSP